MKRLFTSLLVVVTMVILGGCGGPTEVSIEEDSNYVGYWRGTILTLTAINGSHYANVDVEISIGNFTQGALSYTGTGKVTTWSGKEFTFPVGGPILEVGKEIVFDVTDIDYYYGYVTEPDGQQWTFEDYYDISFTAEFSRDRIILNSSTYNLPRAENKLYFLARK